MDVGWIGFALFVLVAVAGAWVVFGRRGRRRDRGGDAGATLSYDIGGRRSRDNDHGDGGSGSDGGGDGGGGGD